MTQITTLPPRLEEIVTDFVECEGREKLELLLEYALQFPSFPEELRSAEPMEEVPECMTPVQMNSTILDGRMSFYFEVPPEAPTVRGFAALMMEGMNGSTPQQILSIPAEFYLRMGLQEVLTPQRMNGMAAILAHVKRRAAILVRED